MTKKTAALLCLLALLASSLAACGDEAPATQTPERPPVTLQISGAVEQGLSWPEAELRAMEAIDVESANRQGEIKPYTGVPINTLLDLAGVQAGASTIVFVADDGYTAEVALDEVRACQDCIVSFRKRGGLSIVMPGFADNLQVKGVIELQIK